MDAIIKQFFSAPNLFTLLRLLLLPALVFCVWSKFQSLFLQLLIGSLASDLIDGYLARRFNQSSELGALLDSWADALTYFVMGYALCMFKPEMFSRLTDFIVMASILFALSTAFSWIKFGCYPSYHPFLAKMTAGALAPAFYIVMLLEIDVYLRIVALLHLLSSLEQIWITLRLRHAKSNIVSVTALY
jgi:CDP-diacylglycerol--glycerol-3-phosphate 3-phosphatidyltransferase